MALRNYSFHDLHYFAFRNLPDLLIAHPSLDIPQYAVGFSVLIRPSEYSFHPSSSSSAVSVHRPSFIPHAKYLEKVILLLDSV